MNSEAFARFLKWRRREDANFFDVFFEDKEYISEKDIKEELIGLCAFLRLDLPEIIFDGPSPLQVEHDDEIFRMRCNVKSLEEKGFNNKDAVISSLIHELSHIYSSNKSWGYIDNEDWEAELYADYMTTYITTKLNVAGGKYRFIVGDGKATITHPYGEIRKKCSEDARNFAKSSSTTFDETSLRVIESQFLLFLLTNAKAINNYLIDNSITIEHALDNPNRQPLKIENLADTNLIKVTTQRILQHTLKTSTPNRQSLAQGLQLTEY